MIKTSEELKDLATALAKAQGELSDAEKSSENPFYKSKYADLAEVLGQIRPIFSKHELSIVQFPHQKEDGHVSVTTRLMHSSGQWMEAELTMPVQGKNIAQDSGSVITYMRRYAAAAVAGIAQVDTDANQADKKDEKLDKPKARQQKEDDQDEDKPWYNTVKEDVDGIKGAMIGGKKASAIVTDLRKRFKVSKESADAIQEYEKQLEKEG